MREKIKQLLLDIEVNKLLWEPTIFLEEELAKLIKIEKDSIAKLKELLTPTKYVRTKEQQEWLDKEFDVVHPWIHKINSDDITAADSFTYVVNITTKDKKKIANVVENTNWDLLELDEDRWDKWFNSLEEAQAYANTFNS